jgi:hypothetical protein
MRADFRFNDLDLREEAPVARGNMVPYTDGS